MTRKSLKKSFDRLQEKVLTEIQSFYGDRLVSVVVFGSVARGAFRPDSDIDVLVIANGLPRGRMMRVEEFSALEERLDPFLASLNKEGIQTRISAVFKTPEEAEKGSPLFLDMVEDARILLDRDQFFARLLRRLRKRLQELGAKRVWRGNCWYWVLKPDYKPGEVFEL